MVFFEQDKIVAHIISVYATQIIAGDSGNINIIHNFIDHWSDTEHIAVPATL